MAGVGDYCACSRCGFALANEEFESHLVEISTYCSKCGYSTKEVYGEDPVETSSVGAYRYQAATVTTYGTWKRRPSKRTLAEFDQARADGSLLEGSYITFWDAEKREVVFLRGDASMLINEAVLEGVPDEVTA